MRSVRFRRAALPAVLMLVAAACAQPVPTAGPAEGEAGQVVAADAHDDGDAVAADEHGDDHADDHGAEADAHQDEAAAAEDHADGDHTDGGHAESFWFGEPADPAEADRVSK